MEFTQKDVERFWSKVDVRGEDECWNSTGADDGAGYKQFHINGRMMRAHRAAFIISGGVITKDKNNVCHVCDNRACCNPKHLFTGTAKDNVHDMVSKGRHSRGESRPATPLKESDVIAIRGLSGKELNTTIARMFGITPTSVGRIIKRQSWSYL